MIGPVSAVLLNFRRPWHIPTIVEHLRGHMQISDITIWCNENEPPVEWDRWDGVRLLWSPKNEYTLGRFLAAFGAKTEHVFFQDDDLLVPSLPALVDAYDGTRIIANLADDYRDGQGSTHWGFWQRDPKPYVELGFGSIMPRKWVHQFLEMRWSYDEELRRRKADKAATCIFPWMAVRAGPHDITRLTHDGAESGRDANALYKRADHGEYTKRSVEAALRYKSSLSFPPE